MTKKTQEQSTPPPLPALGALAPHRDGEVLVRQIHSSPGKAVLARILEDDNPRALVQELPSEDFFWLVKKIGDDDSLAVLALASPDQWHYLLDLELWDKDQLDIDHIGYWLHRLLHADARRLVNWMFAEGEEFASYYFSKNLEVRFKTDEEPYDRTEGLFSLDGVLFFEFTGGEHSDVIEELLRAMAEEDYPRYQNLLLGMAGVIPAETEDELYRLRNVRLAEHGFLPFDEAFEVYAPLKPDALALGRPLALAGSLAGQEDAPPVLPGLIVSQSEPDAVLTKVIVRVNEAVFWDRMQLEFAVLCNRILAAEGKAVRDLEVLVSVGRRAASYLNLALESLCAEDLEAAERLLRSNNLLTVFRVGFGVALSLRSEAVRWHKTSWFQTEGLRYSFWGEEWGSCLTGLMNKRPAFYAGPGAGGGEFTDFSRREELERCRMILQGIMALDSLLRVMAASHALDTTVLKARSLSVHQVLLTLWAKARREGAPGFAAMTLQEIKDLFSALREEGRKPPYEMPGERDRFVGTFSRYAPEGNASPPLERALGAIWQECEEEYSRVRIKDLDERSLRLFWLKPPGVTSS